MVEKVGLIIPDAEAALLKAGELVRTNGILRNAENMEIVKHLQIVDLDAKNCWQELGAAISRVVKENKTGTLVVVSLFVAGATAIGVHIHNKKKKDIEIEEKYNAWINKTLSNYISEATEGELTVETIGACEDALTSLPHITDKVFLQMTKEQIVAFTNGLKDYTKKLAEVNDYKIMEDDNVGLSYEDNVIVCLLNNMKLQKKILLAA